ncbi:MAG: hypothetical protein Tsb009_28930 [Planctomycetaceae bacterium]
MTARHCQRKLLVLALLLLTGILFWTENVISSPFSRDSSPKTAPRVQFDRDVKPIFVKHCYQCHGPKKQESGFRLDRKADALTGGDRGAAIIPGNSKKSLLIRYVAGLDPDISMPPEDDELSKKQIETLRRWIDQGANWPDNKKQTIAP